jgi:hypothetical protein
MGLGMGADKSVPVNDPVCVAISTESWYTSAYLTDRNLMVRMNLNDDDNMVDAVDLTDILSGVEQNFPNPFSDRTEIEYKLAIAGNVSIDITDITGRVVMQLDEGYQGMGEHKVAIDARGFESGIYFYTLKAGSLVETKRMIVR